MGAGSSVVAESFEHAQGVAALKAAQYTDAIAWLTSALSSAPEDAGAIYAHRSTAYLALANPSKALDDALLAIELCPMTPQGYSCAARAAARLEGGGCAARTYAKKALALSPDDASVRALQDTLRDAPRVDGVGHVFSWGAGDDAQLGHGATTSKAMPTMLDAFRGRQVVAVACGAMHTIALGGAHEVYAWGNNQYGQCGLVSGDTMIPIPQLVPDFVGRPVTAVACGAGHSVAILNDGRVFSWGIGAQGQLGLGPDVASSRPRCLPAIEKGAVAVACGIAHTMILMETGDVLSCGLNQYGQLGLGSTREGSVATPRRLSLPGGAVRHIACGGAHSCLVDDAGVVFTCGSNSCGQLGLGHYNDTSLFTAINGLPPVALAVCGEEFSAALTKDKCSVFTWGLGLAGQMGDGSVDGYCDPHLVPDLPETIDFLCAGQAQVFALCDTGSVYTWGLPGDRAFDNASMVPRPQKVGAFFGKKRIHMLACGRKHYVLLARGAVAHRTTLQWAKNTRFIAGAWSKFELTTYDGLGGRCSTGGYIFTSHLSLQSTDDAASALGLASDDTNETTVETNDNMDGSYSGRCRCHRAGSYLLHVTLDEIGIQDHPLALTVAPARVCPPQCSVVWPPHVACPLVQPPGATIDILVTLRDAFGNRIVRLTAVVDDDDVDDEPVVHYQIVDTDNRVVIKASGGQPLTLRWPSNPGEYTLDLGLDGLHGQHAMRGSPFSLRVHATTADTLRQLTEQLTISVPTTSEVGETMSLRIDAPPELLPPDCSFIVRFQSMLAEHTLSARAVVRWGASDPLTPTSVTVSDPPFTATHTIKVAGKYAVVALITNGTYAHAIDEVALEMTPGRASAEFTFVSNWRQLLSAWPAGNVALTLHLELRDAFGNSTPVRDDDNVLAWIAITPDDVTPSEEEYLHVSETVGSRVSLVLPCGGFGASEWLHIHVNGRPIEYAPFALRGDAMLPPIETTESLPPPLLDAASIERLRLEEATRRRAAEALRRERQKRRDSHAKQLALQSMRRTGGGFTVQFAP
ncbi:hypothetical protein SPRG_00222 [Saprolegnia parasitica CBS 223.65]|uniref:RCC1-like domain-containing protein n=1 Tax=Saprolegnia parasitica (strain CBS 223.65) TaxID=695850 RepID=A0A067CXZ5_SAPPC|nr:hypothetical protein SPRG_00222 [Saprolegnia parasitica CBS 223.65]KDO35373.1 hypothetical protein SPRG_00222 [Saprolegnia parasitica CBS 223.65]|eukprot:XP_012193718.1 hypothetical protein SPRG_00222 [Saprolegnia parasitica CBS 223.65]